MKAGWTFLYNATKWHWFGADGRSLCKKWLIFSNEDAKTEDLFGSPANCKVCETKRRKVTQGVQK